MKCLIHLCLSGQDHQALPLAASTSAGLDFSQMLLSALPSLSPSQQVI